MKRLISLLSPLILALLVAPVITRAGDKDDVEKKKTISKSYTVTSNDKLSIENSFGHVVVTTWAKNEIKVDIEIMAKATSEQKAQDIMDEIEVKDSRDGNTISFKTDVGQIRGDKGNKHKKNDDNDDGDDDHARKFYIDYKISMPAGNPLDITNSFGKTNVPDMTGPVNLTSKFGGLTTGKLSNVEEIDVEFGNADIGPVRNGSITFKFNGKSHIANVSGSVKIKSEFSGDVQFDVDNNIQDLAVYESYSTVRMIVTKALSANFDVHTSFGSFKNSTDFNIKEDKEDSDDNSGPRFDKDYSGKANDGKARIKIKSSFGKVRLTDVNDRTSKDDDDDDREESHHKKDKESA